jgi:hypothetical protein
MAGPPDRAKGVFFAPFGRLDTFYHIGGGLSIPFLICFKMMVRSCLIGCAKNEGRIVM